MRKAAAGALLLAASVALGVIPAVAGAAPGGNGKGKGHVASDSCSSPTLSGPTSVAVGDTYTVEGCGFAAGERVALTLAEAGGCCFGVPVYADDAGEFSYSSSAWGAGDYIVRAAVDHNGRMRTVAEWHFSAS